MSIPGNLYSFKECEVQCTNGCIETIPAGSHFVAELDIVSIYLNDNRVFDVLPNTFAKLRGTNLAVEA